MQKKIFERLQPTLVNVVCDPLVKILLLFITLKFRSELQRQLSKSHGEVQHWKGKYETDAIQKTEELEDAKKKLSTRLGDVEEQLEGSTAKCSSLDKAKMRYQNEIDTITIELEKSNQAVAALEKKQKSFDKIVEENNAKIAAMTAEVDNTQKSARQKNAELFKLKANYEEAIDVLEAVKRDTKVNL